MLCSSFSDRSFVTSVQPRSLITQIQEAVADCDDGSSDDGMMLLSLPHDISGGYISCG